MRVGFNFVKYKKGRVLLVVKKENVFNDWVAQEGIEKVAARLNVKRTTVVNWQSGICDPRVCQMRVIKRITKGAVGYDNIIDRKTFRRTIGLGKGGKGKNTRQQQLEKKLHNQQQQLDFLKA